MAHCKAERQHEVCSNYARREPSGSTSASIKRRVEDSHEDAESSQNCGDFGIEKESTFQCGLQGRWNSLTALEFGAEGPWLFSRPHESRCEQYRSSRL